MFHDHSPLYFYSLPHLMDVGITATFTSDILFKETHA